MIIINYFKKGKEHFFHHILLIMYDFIRTCSGIQFQVENTTFDSNKLPNNS